MQGKKSASASRRHNESEKQNNVLYLLTLGFIFNLIENHNCFLCGALNYLYNYEQLQTGFSWPIAAKKSQRRIEVGAGMFRRRKDQPRETSGSRRPQLTIKKTSDTAFGRDQPTGKGSGDLEGKIQQKREGKGGGLGNKKMGMGFFHPHGFSKTNMYMITNFLPFKN